MSKEDKGDIIDMIHTMFFGKPIVLSIGDGYNDSFMLEKSDIGIELVNNQKVIMNSGDILASDLEIVSELIFVTSRTTFARMLESSINLFMLSLTIGMAIFYFNWYAVFTGSSIQESILLFMFNTIINAPSIIIIGITEGSLHSSVLRRFTSLYNDGKIFKSQYWTNYLFFGVVKPLIYSAIIFYTTSYVTLMSTDPQGRRADIGMLSLAITYSIILVFTLEVFYESLKRKNFCLILT